MVESCAESVEIHTDHLIEPPFFLDAFKETPSNAIYMHPLEHSSFLMIKQDVKYLNQCNMALTSFHQVKKRNNNQMSRYILIALCFLFISFTFLKGSQAMPQEDDEGYVDLSQKNVPFSPPVKTVPFAQPLPIERVYVQPVPVGIRRKKFFG